VPKWWFRKRRLSEQNRDPTEQEFFRPEDAVAALVREAVQNSLDAKADQMVRVRFLIPGEGLAVPPSKSREWTRGLERHLGCVLPEHASLIDEPMPFVVIEDFGTHGLLGSTAAANKDELGAGKQDFFYFWRNVGITGKTADERGSWGLGKAVYASSSRIRSMFGLTIRSDDAAPVLMGQSVLRIHGLVDPDGMGQPVQHDAYGFFGVPGTRRQEDEDFVAPTVDNGIIKRFRDAFGLARRTEPGLSLVIPFPSEDLSQPEVDAERYAMDVVRQYAHPILRRELEVEIITPTRTIVLDRDGILAAPDSLPWEPEARWRIEAFLLLADGAAGEAVPVRVLGTESFSARWEDMHIPDAELAECRRRFNGGGAVSFRVPLLVRPKDGAACQSHFDVFLQQDDRLKTGSVVFVRQGLTLSEVQGPSAAGLVGLVLVEHADLARLLRDAENPAHTKWIVRSERLKKNFTGGPDRVKFVEAAPRALLRWLLDTEQELDRELLAEYFPDPDPEAEHQGETAAQGKKREKTPPSPSPPPPKRKAIRIQQLADGFAVTRDPSVPLPASCIVVEAAFDCIAGNPFKAWEPFDFSLDRAPVQTSVAGGTIKRISGNRMEVRIDSDSFRLEVRGFPESRDLAVRHRWLKDSEAEAS